MPPKAPLPEYPTSFKLLFHIKTEATKNMETFIDCTNFHQIYIIFLKNLKKNG